MTNPHLWVFLRFSPTDSLTRCIVRSACLYIQCRVIIVSPGQRCRNLHSHVGQQQKGYAMFFCRCKITCRRRRISNPSGKLILFVPKAGSRSLATLLVPWIVPRTRFYIHLYPNGPNTKSHPHQSSTTN